MAKDPAFLFYSSDFLMGVSDLTMEERGQYITILCIQHQKGRLTKKSIGIAVPNAAADVMAKFTIDEDGLYYNERLEKEAIKRSEHGEKQRQRALSGWEKRKAKADATALPLEDESESESIIEKGVAFPFVDFWNSYDYKIGKHNAEKKWNLLKADEKEVIMKVVSEYVKSTPTRTYRKHPTSWLIGKHWTDDIPQQSNGIPSEPDQSWIATKGKDTQLYQEAAKKWRKTGWVYEKTPGSTVYKWNKIKQ